LVIVAGAAYGWDGKERRVQRREDAVFMNDDDSQETLRYDLQNVEEELAALRRRLGELREQLRDRTDPAGDTADMASLLTIIEEQNALIGGLEARRDQLRRRLGEEGR
jgi:hypothetical protein